jgi:hypothetical protein
LSRILIVIQSVSRRFKCTFLLCKNSFKDLCCLEDKFSLKFRTGLLAVGGGLTSFFFSKWMISALGLFAAGPSLPRINEGNE